MNGPTLKPCPLCGSEPFVEKYDRLISISCPPCGFSRGFPGLLRRDSSPVKVGESEYFHPDAYAEAADGWNRRGGQLE